MNGGHYLAQLSISPAYERIDRLLGQGGDVVLDGGVATELQRIGAEQHDRPREPWGTWALLQGPRDVLEVHRRYLASGCDVLSTNTWSVLEADYPSPSGPGPRHDPLWVDAARQGVRLARAAIQEAGRGGEVAAAFCANSSLLDERAQGRLELLTWAWQEAPPDLVILETLEAIPDRVALETIEMISETGLPVWVSFRRSPQGMSSVDGRVSGDPDPDAFGVALARLEEIGVQAILVNCVPAGGLVETVEWLRARTQLPIGAYPNLGHHDAASWEFDTEVGPREYARLADTWRKAGASVIGGCCGVTPEHIAAIRDLVESTPSPEVEPGG
jgi:S-methylmethionine-dependent homocysteine/selenocysteine methylase